jgi:hypothetical protein
MAATPLPAQPAAPTGAPPPDMPSDFGGASFDSLIRMAAKGMQSDEQIIGQLKDSAAAQRDVAKSIGEFKLPDPPEAPQLPPPPQPQFRSPMEEFGSLASTLAIFGSLLTRHPLTSALNGSAAAMKAMQQGDYQSYQTNMENWKTQTDYAIKMADYQNERYQQILDNDKFSMQQKESMLRIESSANEDLVAASELRSKGIDGLANLLMNRTKLAIAMSRAAREVSGKWSPQNEAYLSYVQEGIDALHLKPGQQPTPQQMAKIQTEAYQQLKQASGSQGTALKYEAIKNDFDATLKMIGNVRDAFSQAPGWMLVGTPGEYVGKPLGSLMGWWNNTPSVKNQFDSAVKSLQNQVNKMMNGRYLTREQTSRLDEIIQAEGAWATPGDVTKSLDSLEETLKSWRDAVPSPLDQPGTGTGATAPDPSSSPYQIQMQDGSMGYSNDGQTWFDENGDPIDTGQ